MDLDGDNGESILAKFDELLSPDLTKEEVIGAYDQLSTTYDEETGKYKIYHKSTYIDVIDSLFDEHKKATIEVLDVGCGTGLVCEKLAEKGFTVLDGIDPSKDMLNQCAQKNIFRNLYCEFFTSQPTTPILQETYDLVMSIGALLPGHLPYDCFHEVLRILKPGGYSCFATREELLLKDPIFQEELLPLLEQLEHERRWRKVKWETFADYHGTYGTKGVVMVYQKTLNP